MFNPILLGMAGAVIGREQDARDAANKQNHEIRLQDGQIKSIQVQGDIAKDLTTLKGKVEKDLLQTKGDILLSSKRIDSQDLSNTLAAKKDITRLEGKTAIKLTGIKADAELAAIKDTNKTTLGVRKEATKEKGLDVLQNMAVKFSEDWSKVKIASYGKGGGQVTPSPTGGEFDMSSLGGGGMPAVDPYTAAFKAGSETTDKLLARDAAIRKEKADMYKYNVDKYGEVSHAASESVRGDGYSDHRKSMMKDRDYNIAKFNASDYNIDVLNANEITLSLPKSEHNIKDILVSTPDKDYHSFLDKSVLNYSFNGVK